MPPKTQTILERIYDVLTHLKCCIHLQWTVQPLVDNYDEDEFQYLIHVHTGFKISSGTKSKVFFRVNGTEGETGVRRMDDEIRQVYSHQYSADILLLLLLLIKK